MKILKNIGGYNIEDLGRLVGVHILVLMKEE